MTERVDFSRNAGVYDQRHGALVGPEVADELVRLAGLNSDSHVLDVGVGTGRIAIPLASRCRTVGIDVALAMLTTLRQKAHMGGTRLPVIVADAMELPFASGQFEAVVLARLLYLLPLWRDALSEAFRVLKPDGHVLHEWGNGEPGEEWVQIQAKARVLFESAGISNPFHPGVRAESDVDEFFTHNGLMLISRVEFPLNVRTTLGDFLKRLERGESSYTWKLPADVQAIRVPELLDWAQTQFDVNHVIDSPMVWKIYRRIRPLAAVWNREGR
jgi:SAM-dependent methyltransferase